MMNVIVLLAATLSTVLGSLNEAPKTTLRLLTLLPDGDTKSDTPFWTRYGAAIRLALDLAAEQINNRTDLLPYHKLELVHEDSGCVDEVNTLTGLSMGLFPKDRREAVIGIIGPICSLDSLLVSSITNRPELRVITLHNVGSTLSLQKSSAAAPPLTKGMNRSNYSLDIIGSIDPLVELSLALLKKSGWHNISVLYEIDSPFYQSIARSFILSAVNEFHANINYVSMVDSNFYPLNEVWNNKARIIFVFTSVEFSRKIMCLAYNLNMVYPDYQFVLTNPTINDFTGQDTIFVYGHKEYRCSQELLVNKSLDRAFLISHQLDTPTPNEVTFANTTFNRFLELYKERIERYNSEHPGATQISLTDWAYSLYDAVWAWAIVLDALISDNEGLMFEYGNETLANLILDQFYSLQFQGISGNITFYSKGGYVNRRASLYQIVNKEAKFIAYSNGTHTVQLVDIHTIADLVSLLTLPHRGVMGFFLTVQCISLTVVVTLHSLTFIYRKTKLVKASSPKLVQPAYFGTYTFILTMMFYASFFTKEQSPTVGVFICQTEWVWLMPLSFTLTMGIVTLRTWRVYRIFFHFTNPGKFISNPALLCILVMMVSVDILIGTLWTALDMMDFYSDAYTTKNTPANEVFLTQTCYSRYNTMWICVVFFYRITLLLAMVTLALLTRKIPNQTFTTASLRIFSYTFSMVMVLGFSVYYVFLYASPYSNLRPIILCVTLNVMLILFIACILAPPLLPVIQRKLKKNSSIK